jgi:hypothetical protein
VVPKLPYDLAGWTENSSSGSQWLFAIVCGELFRPSLNLKSALSNPLWFQAIFKLSLSLWKKIIAQSCERIRISRIGFQQLGDTVDPSAWVLLQLIGQGQASFFTAHGAFNSRSCSLSAASFMFNLQISYFIEKIRN